jgi:Sulfotransferase family
MDGEREQEADAIGVMRRCFVVGSPRSGTTLVQAHLAAHPAVWSLPETHFFHRLEPYRYGPRGTLVRRGAEKLLVELSEQVGRPWVVSPRPTLASYVRRFAAILDEAAAAEGASAWVEKTPGHLHYLNLIHRYIPDAVFVHVTRSGPDVVASIVQVTREHPEGWDGARSIEVAAARWRNDMKITEVRRNEPSHAIVRYEDLVEGQDALLPLWRLLDVPAVEVDHRASADSVIRPSESWKRDVGANVSQLPSRFASLTEEERKRIVDLVG